ncbi:hypothetical protein Tco_0979140 [Tanacetum coccineum]
MGNEELSTIPEKESDEFIKSSIEDLVPILSESEDTPGSDSESDLPSCDDFPPINILEGKSMTFSNPLFGSNEDFTSSDNESLSDEDVPEDKVKIYSNPLFEFNDEYISSNVNPLFDEEIEIRPSRAKMMRSMLYKIWDSFYEIWKTVIEGDIIYPESLLINDTIPNLPPEVFLDHEPRSLNNKLDNLKSMVKVFDPGIHEKFFSLTYVRFLSRDTFSISFIRNPLCPVIETLVPFSSKNEDKVFNLGILPSNLLSY